MTHDRVKGSHTAVTREVRHHLWALRLSRNYETAYRYMAAVREGAD